MRSLLFRTAPILVDTTEGVVFTKDFDGMTPVTLTVENEDVAAYVDVSDRFGSPHSKLRFTWGTAGAGGNAKSVVIEEDTEDVNGIAVAAVGNVVTYTIGAHVQAWQIVAMLDGEQGMSIALAPGSDGSAPIIPPRLDDSEDPLEYELDNGADATTTGAAKVEIASKVTGPWVNDSAAATALGTVAEGAPKSYTYTVPVRCIRYKLSKGSSDTHVVCSARVGRTA
jgi:hypothetical protein